MSSNSPNLLNDDSDVLVCTTNAMGVMGKGIALDFAKRWPSIVSPYKEACQKRLLKGGACCLFHLPTQDLFSPHKRYWAAFCTKHDWRQPSQYEWVESGMRQLVSEMESNHLTSVAIPALGCGLGGLQWTKVKTIIEEVMQGHSIQARIYPPYGMGSPYTPGQSHMKL
jgi:O-acetyl-ADP-ribose deacetylase (regulator of RNase III)